MNGMNPDDYFDWIASIEAFFDLSGKNFPRRRRSVM